MNKIFNDAFDDSIWQNSDKLDFLTKNINAIENRIAEYLENIIVDFPFLTDHSIDHSKMLWNYAQVIIGNKEKYINPMEAFILHVAFLIHDSGMCYSILNNKSEIEKDSHYSDYITRNNTDKNKEKDALFHTVRYRHGDYALRIATTRLKKGEFLIDDINLREEFGSIIGKIAKSHTCNPDYIEREFSSNYCSPKYPTDWSVDCHKLSYLLRTADAAHIDNLRTPKTNRMIAEIPGVSKDHWTFQKKIGFPEKSDDNLLVYSTHSTFQITEQKAWWFCYDALKVLDKELKIANEYFTTKRKEGLTVIGVKSINNTLELGRNYIKTEGWDAVDTNIKVSNPIHLATQIGGINLYGNANVAVRELIQNSIDAINLYRLYTEQDSTEVGEITLSVDKEGSDYFLTVTDNGMGMSRSMLTNELLDFGSSYWKSNRFNEVFVGLASQGFEAIGKFGIGFFSIFMISDEVKITSWKYEESRNEMKILEFYDGLTSTPIVREPSAREKQVIIDRGTSIRMKLLKHPYSQNGIIGSSQFIENKLFSLVKFFTPSCNVQITTIEEWGETNYLAPNQIESLSSEQLLDYNQLKNMSLHGARESFEALKSLGLEMIDIKDESSSFGRLCLLPTIGKIGYSSTCIVLSNGIRIKELGDFCGYILTDNIISIKRDRYDKIIPFNALKKWAEKQKQIIDSCSFKHLYNNKYWGLLVSFGLNDDTLPIALTKIENVYSHFTIAHLKKYLSENQTIKFYREEQFYHLSLATCEGFVMLHYRFDISEIIKKEDQKLLIERDDLIKSIIQESWGEYNYIEHNLVIDNFRVDKQYTLSQEYTKK